MTTLNEAREAIYKTLIDGWTAAYPTLPIIAVDEQTKPPTSGAWCRFGVYNIDSDQETLGAIGQRRFLRSLSIVVEVISPKPGALKLLDGYAQTVRGLLEGVSGLQGTTTYTQNATIREAIDDSYWTKLIINVDAFYHETR